MRKAENAFLIFGQRNKTGTALRNLSINKPERTICANNIIRYITESQKRGSVFFTHFLHKPPHPFYNIRLGYRVKMREIKESMPDRRI